MSGNSSKTEVVFRLDGRGGADNFPLSKWKKNDRSRQTVWVALNLARREDVQWIHRQEYIPEWIREGLTDEDNMPPVYVRQNHVFLTLRTVNISPHAEPDDMVFLRVFATERFVVTARLHPALDFQDIHALFQDKEGPRQGSDLLPYLLESTLDNVVASIEAIEERVDDYEELIVSGCISKDTYRLLSESLRQVIVIRRFIVPERDVIDMLVRHPAVWFTDETERGLKSGFNRIQRLIEDIDLLEKRIRINQDAVQNEENTKTQRNMYILSVMAGIFLPLSFLTGLFGMNLQGIPLGEHPNGFLAVCLVMILIGVIVVAVFKKKKWI